MAITPTQQKGEVIIYHSKEGKGQLEIKLERETVWLSQEQIVNLFQRDKSVISRHIRNIFLEKELTRKSVVANFATTASDGKTYQVEYYNLDVVLSVGYRVNSKRATQFRIWATSILKDHLLQGYTVNPKRLQEKGLKEFEEAVALIKRTIDTKALNADESQGLLEIITGYASAWLLLQKYDQGDLVEPKTRKTKKTFGYDFCQKAIAELKKDLIKKKEASELFGQEKDAHFKGILETLYQTFDKIELYPSIEEKAAHLLYFIIKDHPFIDGNKRIASFLFIVFLSHHQYLFQKNGEKKINENTLVALALLIAQSNPRQKELLVKLVMHFLSEK